MIPLTCQVDPCAFSSLTPNSIWNLGMRVQNLCKTCRSKKKNVIRTTIESQIGICQTVNKNQQMRGMVNTISPDTHWNTTELQKCRKYCLWQPQEQNKVMYGVKQSRRGVKQGRPGDTSCTFHTHEQAEEADLTEVKQNIPQQRLGRLESREERWSQGG